MSLLLACAIAAYVIAITEVLRELNEAPFLESPDA
jgi:hypothetical protein